MAKGSRNQIDEAGSLTDVAVSDDFVIRLYARGVKDFSQLVWAFEFVIIVYQSFPRDIHRARDMPFALAIAARRGAVAFRFADINDRDAWLVQILLHRVDLGDHVASRVCGQLAFRELRSFGGNRPSFFSPRLYPTIEIRNAAAQSEIVERQVNARSRRDPIVAEIYDDL